MHFHIVFGNTDGDILHWKNSLPKNTFSHYVREILSAEKRRRIAVIPLPEQPGISTGRIETHIRIPDRLLSQYILSIPKRKRSTTIKNIIRKHISVNYKRLSMDEQPAELSVNPKDNNKPEELDDYRKMLLQISGS